MSESKRLRVPTLIPEWANSEEVQSDYQGPKTHYDDFTSPNIPISHTSSGSSSVQIKSTYHSIIEANTSYISKEITPYVNQITKQNKGTINEYSLGSSLGHGQFGKVYKAYSKSTGSMVAIKRIAKKPWNTQQYSMNQTMRQIQIWRSRGLMTPITGDEAVMLMNVQKCRWELYVMSRLSNSYVVRIKECLDSPFSSSIWIVNEWCSLGELDWKRESVNEVLPQWNKFLPQCNSHTFTRKVLIDMTCGLKYLWSQGCIHRDIKPSNILIDGNQGLIKISDFGCSILVPKALPFNDESLRQCYQAELNKIVGTPAFIAPELCHFEESEACNVKNGFQLDIWSLGVTLYGLLYNELPFYGDNEFDTYHRVVNDSLDSMLNGESLNDLVISRLLQKDPNERIGIEELAQAVLPADKKDGLVFAEKKRSKTNGDRESVKKFFKKFWRSKGKNKRSSKENADIEKEQTVPISAKLEASLPRSEQTDHSTSSSGSSSSYEEPIQITKFIDSGPLSHSPQESSSSKDDESERKSENVKGNEINDVVSIQSISPIKIPTPIKALIRIGNIAGSKKASTSKGSASSSSPLRDKHQNNKLGSQGLAHSKDIVNFQKYIEPQDPKATNSKRKAQSTPEDIEEYLRYADNIPNYT